MLIEVKNQEQFNKHLPAINELKLLAIDVETTGLDPYTGKPVLFQIGNKDVQYVIHWYNVNIAQLKPLLESPNTIKVFHNHKFDYKWIKYHAGIEVDTNVFDTMLAHQVLHAGKFLLTSPGSSMAAVAKKYLGIEMDKSVRLEFTQWRPGVKITKRQAQYSADDLVIPLRLRDILRPQIIGAGLADVAILEFGLSAVVGDMELNGMYVDQDMWKELAIQVDRKLKQSKNMLDNHFSPVCDRDLFGDPIINYGSPVQMVRYLNKLGIKVKNTNKATLQDNEDIDAVAQLIDYRKWQKRNSSYGINFLRHINPVTNRVHSSFKQMVRTGRMSSRDPNLQNVTAPRKKGDLNFRAPFQNQEFGDMILTIDYSGCELRILAELSNDPVLVSAFQSEIRTGKEADVHSMVAELMFQTEVSKIVNEHLRSITKNLNFGLIYGMGPKKLARELGVSVQEAKRLMAQYFETLPGIADYLDRSAKAAVSNGYADTIMGRRRHFELPSQQEFFATYEPSEEELEEAGGSEFKAKRDKYNGIVGNIERQGKNTPIQGTNGDLVKRALINLRDDIKRNNRDIKIINTVHDEIVFEGSDLQSYEPIARSIMLEAQAVDLKKIPPRVDGTIDISWSK